MKLKRTIKSATAVTAAMQIGTTYYRVTLDDIESVMQDSTDANIWILKSFQELGWDAIDFEHNLFGSQVIDNVLYICNTDGRDIDVRGEKVDPETALDDYKLSDLSTYIEDADEEIILKYITPYEIKTPKFNNWASELLKDGYTFTDLVNDAQEFSDF